LQKKPVLYKIIEYSIRGVVFVMNNIIVWLSERDWTSWEMVGAIGQVFGAFATVWTARIALRASARG
jgi:hypothetical protein